MEDDEFLRNLKDITGEDAVWEGFDPSAWRSVQPEDEEPEAVESGMETVGSYDSDDSAEHIFNFHKLSPEEKRRAGRLNKAREYASTETGLPRELAKLENVKWKETGLAIGDVSAEGDVFVAWRLVECYPDMFVGKANSIRVSARVSALR